MSCENKGEGDSPLVTGRIGEKSDLQNLNQRFSAYIQNVRSWRLKQVISLKKIYCQVYKAYYPFS